MTPAREPFARVEGHRSDFRVVISGDVLGKTWQFHPSAKADCDKVNAAHEAAVQKAVEKIAAHRDQLKMEHDDIFRLVEDADTSGSGDPIDPLPVLVRACLSSQRERRIKAEAANLELLQDIDFMHEAIMGAISVFSHVEDFQKRAPTTWEALQEASAIRRRGGK